MIFTKDAIFQQLCEAYTGPGGTAEGSFAGDILRACADALAELYSTEIDGLAGRAFVSQAVGDDLTAVCADRGVLRLEGEPDEELRQRTLQRLASTPASGNADHYAAWCGEIDEILRVKVLPLARGNGTVDILAIGLDGRAAGGAVLQAAQTVIDRERPVGADARVCAPTETALNVAGAVTLMDGATLEQVKADFTAAFAAFCKSLALRTQVVSFAKVLRLLLDCPGVADVTGFTLQGGEDSVTLPEHHIGTVGTVALTAQGG